MPHASIDKMAPAPNIQNSCSHHLEVELLLQSSRAVTSSSGEDRIRNLVGQQIDWDLFIRIAQYHRVVPLLYRTLKRVAENSVPEPVMTSLRKRFQISAQHNLFFLAELLQVLQLFDQHHIE